MHRMSDTAIDYLTSGRDKYAAHTIWLYLQKQFPQLNEQTKMQYTEGREVHLPLFPDVKGIANDYPYPKKGVKAWFWRVVGELFGKQAIAWRGRYLGPNPFAPKPLIRRIQIQQFGFQLQGFDKYVDDPIGLNYDTTIIRCGYDALNDVLYVYSKPSISR
jgi:hypothetical protein